ncbi:MAG: GNAT family N-acetyltransferase [Erysipelotrichaceae bacterium]|nr:GNAT family N-acetyltransferase [Erysipelotrichaceae bacterium]
MSIIITEYRDEYLDDIRGINLAVSTHPDRPWEEKELCRHLYIDYYAFNAKDSCFVALDTENNEVLGYIIAEPDFQRYKNHILNEYMPEAKALREDFEDILKEEIRPYEKWNGEYDAHMHMDVKPGHQHQGIGTMLIQRMFEHLKDIGSKGVMLQVSKRNENANRFYEKNGMEIIDEAECYIRGKKL